MSGKVSGQPYKKDGQTFLECHVGDGAEHPGKYYSGMVNLICRIKGELTVCVKNKSSRPVMDYIDATSVLAMMALEARKDSKLEFCVSTTGERADVLLREIDKYLTTTKF